MKPWKKYCKRELYGRIEALQQKCAESADKLSKQGQSIATRDKRIEDLEGQVRAARKHLANVNTDACDRSDTIARLRKDLDTAKQEIKILRAAPGSGLLAASLDREIANAKIIEDLRRKMKEERSEHDEKERLFRANEAAQETVIARERAKSRRVEPLQRETSRLSVQLARCEHRAGRALDLIAAPEAVPGTGTGVDLAAYRSDLLARVAVILRGP